MMGFMTKARPCLQAEPVPVRLSSNLQTVEDRVHEAVAGVLISPTV